MPSLDELDERINFSAFFHDYAIPWTTNILVAVAIFLIGRLVSKWVLVLARKSLGRARLDPMLVQFLVNVLGWVLFLAVLIAALDRVGVNTTSFVAILGAAGLAVGLALKDSLQNFAAGLILILFRPFHTGDVIETSDIKGTVEEVRIFSTLIRTADNRMVTVPNGTINTEPLINLTAKENRRVELVIGIGYEDDLRAAKEVLARTAADTPGILADPPPYVGVDELAASTVNLNVFAWTRSVDYFRVKCDLTERVKLALDEAGISMPFPQLDLYLKPVTSS